MIFRQLLIISMFSLSLLESANCFASGWTDEEEAFETPARPTKKSASTKGAASLEKTVPLLAEVGHLGQTINEAIRKEGNGVLAVWSVKFAGLAQGDQLEGFYRGVFTREKSEDSWIMKENPILLYGISSTVDGFGFPLPGLKNVKDCIREDSTIEGLVDFLRCSGAAKEVRDRSSFMLPDDDPLITELKEVLESLEEAPWKEYTNYFITIENICAIQPDIKELTRSSSLPILNFRLQSPPLRSETRAPTGKKRLSFF